MPLKATAAIGGDMAATIHPLILQHARAVDPEAVSIAPQCALPLWATSALGGKMVSTIHLR
eukprot:CAMPEP_0115659738 /NCGR_PEP_ID=MMETSP0272-20121206/45876_1 /TAXON_ID=71861 /ORGANISM="Scrippsiella trochoidea, Strain CCMP3099" /LENGTH=60 /DNA_ID=CAMNT_0003097857 /DNA_START=249 /DNA_END=428 /DNA_ORIENTATION=-